MPTLTLYPSGYKAGSGSPTFTDAQLANVVGNTTTYAVHTGSQLTNAGLSGTFYFPMTTIPAGSIINSIAASVIAKVNAVGYRREYSIDLYGGAGSRLNTIDAALTTADATYSTVFAGVGGGFTNASLRNDAIEWTNTFVSSAAGTVTTSWQKFWLTVDYTLAAGGPNALFVGENF